MSRKIKLIWDFRGEDALEMAKHHCVHLKEFTQIDKLIFYEIRYTQLNDFYSIAFITINETNMIAFRDRLKPHRGELAE